MYSGPSDKIPPLNCPDCVKSSLKAKEFARAEKKIVQAHAEEQRRRRFAGAWQKTNDPTQIKPSNKCSFCGGAFQIEDYQFREMNLLSTIPCGHLYHTICLRNMIAGVKEMNQQHQKGGGIRHMQKFTCSICRAPFIEEEVRILSSSLLRRFLS